MREVYKFESLEQLHNFYGGQLGQLDNANKEKIAYQKGKTWVEVPDRCAIVGGNYNYGIIDNVYSVANNDYTLIEHYELVNEVTNVLKECRLQTYGNIINMGGKMYMHTLFPEHNIEDETKDGIDLGIRWCNSYDLSCGLNFGLYGMRIVCENGMMMKQLLMESHRKHVGEIDLHGLIENFIGEAVHENKRFAHLISGAMGDVISRRQIPLIVNNIIKVKKHAEIIQNTLINFKFQSEFSRWQLYNTITQYVSHQPLGNSVITTLENVASRLLSTRFGDILVSIEEDGGSEG